VRTFEHIYAVQVVHQNDTEEYPCRGLLVLFNFHLFSLLYKKWFRGDLDWSFLNDFVFRRTKKRTSYSA